MSCLFNRQKFEVHIFDRVLVPTVTFKRCLASRLVCGPCRVQSVRIGIVSVALDPHVARLARVALSCGKEGASADQVFRANTFSVNRWHTEQLYLELVMITAVVFHTQVVFPPGVVSGTQEACSGLIQVYHVLPVIEFLPPGSIVLVVLFQISVVGDPEGLVVPSLLIGVQVHEGGILSVCCSAQCA